MGDLGWDERGRSVMWAGRGGEVLGRSGLPSVNGWFIYLLTYFRSFDDMILACCLHSIRDGWMDGSFGACFAHIMHGMG